MTTSEALAKNLKSQGAEAVMVDAFDAAEVEAALRQAKAEVIIDELTSLPKEQSEMPKYTEAAAIAGEDVVYYATKLSGASNAKAKRVLEWKPRRLEWLEA